MFQKQLEDYLNNLLQKPMYRNYHATVCVCVCVSVCVCVCV